MITTIEKDICCKKTKVILCKDCTRDIWIKGKGLIIRQKGVIRKFKLEKNMYEIIINGGENDKTLDIALKIINILKDKGFTRNDSIIAIGGGTVSDLVGFVSSIYKRGINLVSIPTTLLAMVDASIGGKNSINLAGIKNVLGTFYQPSLVYIDLSYLATLPNKELLNGISEVIKYGITLDKDLFDYLAQHREEVMARKEEDLKYVIHRSVLDKMNIVMQDPFESKGIRIVLNFGHTIAHGIEASSNFSIPHGMAVAIGLVVETEIAEDLGLVNHSITSLVKTLVKSYALPTSFSALNIDLKKVCDAIEMDKKRIDEFVYMPFPIRIGEWIAKKVPIQYIKTFLSEVYRNGVD
ncbi:MAG: 3-dehydroquinate synthase [Caldisphaeraceae archaeon]|nr:3-dehydroquinate synthase [Caldisphaeraceae archaeon]MEB3691863.1 3-dehydroquinate synthase [Caldisphaeraceae archaeon]MEB3798129.1 3-dehydroquinate synthase [Caldisphaeraceae archaeon]